MSLSKQLIQMAKRHVVTSQLLIDAADAVQRIENDDRVAMPAPSDSASIPTCNAAPSPSMELQRPDGVSLTFSIDDPQGKAKAAVANPPLPAPGEDIPYTRRAIAQARANEFNRTYKPGDKIGIHTPGMRATYQLAEPCKVIQAGFTWLPVIRTQDGLGVTLDCTDCGI